MKKCPHCAKLIPRGAADCRHCGRALNEAEGSGGSPSHHSEAEPKTTSPHVGGCSLGCLTLFVGSTAVVYLGTTVPMAGLAAVVFAGLSLASGYMAFQNKIPKPYGYWVAPVTIFLTLAALGQMRLAAMSPEERQAYEQRQAAQKQERERQSQQKEMTEARVAQDEKKAERFDKSRIEFCVLCKQRMERNLKAPSTADYPFGDCVGIKNFNGRAIYSGQVDSQNSFGAMVRTRFLCTAPINNLGQIQLNQTELEILQ